MKPRYALAAVATTLLASAASAQYVPATYQEPYCREFTKVIDVGSRPQSGYGQACMQPDGSWKIVSDAIPSNQPVQYNPQYNYVEYQPVVQPVTYDEPTYYRTPPMLSFNFSNWNPGRTRYYNDHGQGWRDWNRGRDDWNNGHGPGFGRDNGPGRGQNRH